MRIKYFGANKENEGRVALIRFTDKEWELYEYIANYEKAYGDDTREFFNGHIIAVERDENGVDINEAYVDVEDFDDYNEFKANYKEAKKEFLAMKKTKNDITAEEPETAEPKPEEQASEEPETSTETSTEPETATAEPETKSTTEKVWTVTQFPHVVRTFNKNGKMVYEDFFETAEKAYEEYVDITENSKRNLPYCEETTVTRFAEGKLMCCETIKGTCFYNSVQKIKATETETATATEAEGTAEPETATAEEPEHKMDDSTFNIVIRNAKNLPRCDFPNDTKILEICKEMNSNQLSEFCKILFEKGVCEYWYGQMVTSKRHLLISPAPDMSGGA